MLFKKNKKNKLGRNDYSIHRQEQYRHIAQLELNGKILDLAGSKTAGYHELIDGDHVITTVNINPDYDCDIVANIEEPFPFKDQEFDHVMAINVLEHIYNYRNVLTESARVVKSGGTIILAIPFFHHVHGSPDDYYRYTDSTLRKLLEEYGFMDISIHRLGYGVCTANLQILMGVIPTRLLRRWAKDFCIFCDKFFARLHPGFRRLQERIPIGYFVTAVKK